MKKLICVVLCAVMIMCVFPSCLIKSAAGQISGSRYYTEGEHIFNIIALTKPADFLTASDSIKSVNAQTYIGTGDTVTFNDDTVYTAVIYGDTDGDGIITAVDYGKTKRQILNTYVATEIELLAMSSGSAPTAIDYMRIKRHVLGTYNLYSTLHKTFEADYNGMKIAYVPLDNRPVNFDRAKYLAQSAGFDLLMPDEDLFRTALDNMSKNSNGTTYGDRAKLLEWLKSVESICDYYVISLDQMLSGGLVASRWLSNTDLTLETEIADYLISLSKTKHVILFDTVMRLASTVNYMGYQIDEYNILRSYGAKARRTLSGSELTVNNIIAGYKYGTDGNLIYTSLSDSDVSQYLASRSRKLKLIDYILQKASKKIEYIYVGVDDSSPTTTIQTNEINYIKGIAGTNCTLFAGADELGLMGIARFASKLYGEAQANVTYFGEGKDYAADGFDIGTLSENVEKHLLCVGATITSSDPDALQVLVLTKSSDVASKADALIQRLKSNIAADIPTAVIDASTEVGILQAKMTSQSIPLSCLLGYSSWNTVGNAVGISVSQAVARYLYIRYNTNVTNESNIGFLKSMTFAYIKDISYKIGRIDISAIAADTGVYGGKTLLALINSSKIMTGIGKMTTHSAVSVSNFRYPWNRTFEMTFDVSVGR